MTKIKRATTKEKPKEEKDIELIGLEQSFETKSNKKVPLRSFLKEGDWWVLKGRKKTTIIILHEAVKKIADEAGIKTDPDYTVLTQPSYENNYQYLIQARICDDKGRCTTELGEVNRSNLGPRGRHNPANMAQKRAFDRAVFRHLGISGLLGEDEIEEDEIKKDMDELTHEERQAISMLINDILLAKNKADLMKFKVTIKKQVKLFNERQLDVLRNLWKKQLAAFEKSF